MRATLGRLGWTLAFAAAVGAGVLASRAALAPSPYRVAVPVQDAAGLYPGSDVMIAGARVGRVESVALRGGSALVTLAVDPEHAPLSADATIAIRPKSLLGERYVALDPGQAAATLPGGSTLPATSVTESTSLEDVVSAFDQPTRDKLQTLIVELGGGVAGRGEQLNAGLAAGKEDLGSLRGIAAALASRDADLRSMIADLDSVTGELATSDRRQQLGELIRSLETLLHDLADQEAELKQALAEADSTLSRASVALDGTGGSLADIAGQVPVTVHLADLLMADLGPDSDALLPHLQQFDAALAAGPSVFGGVDASGYATRISVLIGCGSAGPCVQPGVPAGQGPAAASGTTPSFFSGGAAALPGQDPGLNAIASLLLGGAGR
ncbi:MAG TPA: MlaD family protein [Candidatus Dormibacteraeota bacterium]|nr:MlaD family protein [Candidatus Dormibacteraeota bacterium]